MGLEARYKTAPVILKGGLLVKQLVHIATTTLGIVATASPALAAESYWEQHRSTFAGATVRLELGGRQAPPAEARLGIGFVQDRRNSGGEYVGRSVAGMPIALGVANRQLQLFAGGEELSQSQKRLRFTGETPALLVLGGVAAGVIAVILLTDGDDDDDATSPCPPGVEVCTQGAN